MENLLSMLPILLFAALAIIGLIEYVKVFVEALRTSHVTLGLILSPIISILVGGVVAPILFGVEVVYAVTFFFYWGATALVLLALVQLFYDRILKTVEKILDGLAHKVGGKI